MANRFLQVSFNFKIDPDLDDLEDTFDKALDWYRHSINSWVVWTSGAPEKWYSRLKKHLEDGDTVFICELNIEERSGWMPRRFWDFIKSHQPQSSKSSN
jgi:hypothetical protein